MPNLIQPAELNGFKRRATAVPKSNLILEFSSARQCLFPFRKRSLPFLTVDAIIGNQAFSHGRSNICSGLMYNKATNTFLNSLRKNKD